MRSAFLAPPAAFAMFRKNKNKKKNTRVFFAFVPTVSARRHLLGPKAALNKRPTPARGPPASACPAQVMSLTSVGPRRQRPTQDEEMPIVVQADVTKEAPTGVLFVAGCPGGVTVRLLPGAATFCHGGEVTRSWRVSTDLEHES